MKKKISQYEQGHRREIQSNIVSWRQSLSSCLTSSGFKMQSVIGCHSLEGAGSHTQNMHAFYLPLVICNITQHVIHCMAVMTITGRIRVRFILTGSTAEDEKADSLLGKTCSFSPCLHRPKLLFAFIYCTLKLLHLCWVKLVFLHKPNIPCRKEKLPLQSMFYFCSHENYRDDKWQHDIMSET